MQDHTPTIEEWVPVVGYEGFYEVSSLGRVRSVDREFIRADGRRQCRRGRLLKPTPSGRGYPSVTLRHGVRRTVHILVCIAFHGPRPHPDYDAAHNNGVLTDNRRENLRWATKSENQQDSVRHGTKRGYSTGVLAGESSLHAKLTQDQVAEMRRRWDAGEATQAALAAEYGVSKSQAHNIVHRKNWSTT